MGDIYRVLDIYEEMHFCTGNKIYNNGAFDGFCCVDSYDNFIISENLDNIISHVQHGNTTTSKWISCSKDLITDLEKYSISSISYKKNERPCIAVIRNYDQSVLNIEGCKHNIFDEIKVHQLDETLIKKIEYIRSLPISKINKMVVDLNDTELLYNLFSTGFIRTKEGNIPSLDSRAFRYARDAKEILVFSEIKNEYRRQNVSNLIYKREGVPYLLKPIVYDVLYTLMKTGSISQTPENVELYKIINSIQKFSRDNLTKLEQNFYSMHYNSRQTIDYIISTYNDSRLDVLSLYNEFLKIKRGIIYKIINWLNIDLGKNYNKDIILLEDPICLIRSDGNYQKINVVLYDCTLEVPPLENKPNTGVALSEIGNNYISSIYQYGNEDNYYTIRNGNICRVYMDEFKKSKQHIKKIIG